MNSRTILERLVSFQTVSSASNLDCIAFIRAYLDGFGIESRLVSNGDGRKASLFATIGPAAAGGVVLSGHTDVVPVAGQDWTGDPRVLAERDGRFFGRGVCDMKGFLASALAAVPAFVGAGPKRPVHLAFSHDEEVGCLGAPDLVAAMSATIPTPSAVVVGEPTSLHAVGGHKASLSFFTRVRGRSVHSSRIDTGVSAVMVGCELVHWLTTRMAENEAARDPASSFLPPYTTVHCGMIRGGTAANIVASECEFVTDVRAMPDDPPERLRDRYLDHIRTQVEPRMRRTAPETGVTVVPRSHVPGLAPEPDGGAARLVRTLGIDDGGVVSYGTEAGIFQRAGWSAVVCGPGDIAQAHQPDEWLAVAQLEAVDAFMNRLATHLRG